MYRKIFGRFEDESHQIEFFSTIFDNLPVAVFCKDADDEMRVILWNKNAERMFGYSAENVLGKTASDYLPEDQANKYMADDLSVVKENRTFYEPDRIVLNPQTGEQVNFRIWKVPVKTRRGCLVLCIAQDITAIRRAELENREQERQLRSISTNVPGLLYQFKVDPERKFSFTFFSAKAFEILGVDNEEILQDADAIIKLIHEDDLQSFERSLYEANESGSAWRWEGRLRTRNRGLRWFQGASTPAMLEDGSSLWDGLLLDVTSQKEVEEKLRLQEAHLAGTSKLVALGEMAGGIAHEINTPLNAILFCSEQIQSSLKDNSFDKRDLLEMSDLISETAQRIAKIVRGLKTFARDGSKEIFEEVDVESVVDQALSLCGQRMEQNGISVEFVKPLSPLLVDCRAVQLGQVVLNLLNNSFDAVVTTEKSWIKVEIKSDEQSVFIEVTDSGNGLPDEVKSKLFQPFFTTKQIGKGTGIGLSISRGIVESHEGRIFIDEKSANTKFVIQLPLKHQIRGVA